MEVEKLIKQRVAYLKEKELRFGLSSTEILELGKLYIAEEVVDVYHEIARIAEDETWKSRAIKAERKLTEIIINNKKLRNE